MTRSSEKKGELNLLLQTAMSPKMPTRQHGEVVQKLGLVLTERDDTELFTVPKHQLTFVKKVTDPNQICACESVC